ncbi:MASE1 domain-containing protein [Bordetella genomosp. 10]|uniref:MASE1 domain-containing protein n=1 Tax=Bordetella genomosp. 10 TaxID=1416804 RepID=UPI0015C66297|nr:MASE1 domain-containing protein [Bordetella genomosp. 10]
MLFSLTIFAHVTPTSTNVARNAFLLRFAFVLAYGLLAVLCMRDRDAVTMSTLLWPPAGLLLAALMLSCPRRWPGWMALAATLHVASGVLVAQRGLPAALVFAAGDLALCGAVAAVWRWGTVDRRSLARVGSVLWFIVPLAAASVAGGWLVAQGLHAVDHGIDTQHWYIWTQAAFVGCLIATPLVVAWSNWRAQAFAEQDLRYLWLGLAAAFALLAGTTLVFNKQWSDWLWQGRPAADLTYAPLVFLAFVAVAWGQAGCTLVVTGLAIVTGSYTLSGLGPYGGAGGVPLVAIQGFLGAAALLSLLLGALSADRERATREAVAWKQQLQSALRTSHHLAWEFFPDTRRVIWLGDFPSPYGPACQPDTTVEQWLSYVHEDDRARLLAWVESTGKPDAARRLRARLLCADRQYHEVELNGSAVRLPDGSVASVTGLLSPWGDTSWL